MPSKSVSKFFLLLLTPIIICFLTFCIIDFFVFSISNGLHTNNHQVIQTAVITSLNKTKSGTDIIDRLKKNAISIKNIKNDTDIKKKTGHILTHHQSKLLSKTFRVNQRKYAYKTFKSSLLKNNKLLVYILVVISILLYASIIPFVSYDNSWKFTLTSIKSMFTSALLLLGAFLSNGELFRHSKVILIQPDSCNLC